MFIVEDHPDYRQILALQARAVGYEIIEAETRSGGVVKAISELPDLIVMEPSYVRCWRSRSNETA